MVLDRIFNNYYARILRHLVRHPSHLCPHLVYSSVTDIPFAKLRQAGFEAVIFDKDNTLTDHDIHELTKQGREGLERAVQVFGKQNVVLFSNNLKAHSIYINKVRYSDIVFLSTGAAEKKPFCADLIGLHFKNKVGTVVDPRRVVVVGDRLMTDVCLGRMMGGLAVLVLPWDLQAEQSKIKVTRWLENLVWSRVYKNKLAAHDNELIKELASELSR